MRIFVLLLAMFWIAPTPAWAQEPTDAAGVLARVDAVASQAKDFTAHIELETVEPSGTTTKRSFTVWQKGTNHRMLKLTKPARLKGVGMLATGPDELYMYLPAFGRVRRVAGRKRGEPFLGSNFTQDDMARTQYASRFTPTLVKQDEGNWTLRLDPKKPADEPHHHLVITVRKSDALVSLIELFDADAATPTRRLVATDFKVVDSVPFAHRIEATDLEDSSRSTVVLSDIRVDTGLETSFFSHRHLKRNP